MRKIAFAVLRTSLASATSIAQTTTIAASDTHTNAVPACDYDRCALRFTLAFGSWRVVQGADNRKIGNVGFFAGLNIEPLVRDVPEAARAAREFRSSYAYRRA